MRNESESEAHDKSYYEVAKSGSLADRAMIIARKKIYQDFTYYCHPGANETILDVGVSDVIQGSDNIIERLSPVPTQITAAGLGEGVDFRKAFPDINYVRIESGTELPFADKTFTIATANAVLEHVGSIDGQRRFIGQLLRVAERVFLSVPNRFFPIEHHTAIPFLAWNDSTFRLGCKILGKEIWADQNNLILMSRSGLRSLLPRPEKWVVGYTGIKFGPLSSNLFAYSCQKLNV
ncbi:Methyltransferase family protein [Thiomonas sp. X19]|uniref:methyltransferase n=1 Tax=Thiomonas sp. X19 TaxID=1050370 RepID=UPI000B7144A9|nr:methyltransferase [Thiomonas sp. X19]SCC93043.1 Methyltransferase family protein [Thiomonas sp. X19]